MAIATLATNGALETVMTKAIIPLANVALSRGLLTNRANGYRSISTVSSPSTIKRPNSPISPTSVAFRNVSRQFSTDRHLYPYERFIRRTPVNWGIQLVPQHEAFVIERFGKFHKVLEAGLHVMVPFVDRISYIHSLKEQIIDIPEQPVVTTDNISIRVNGVLFVKVIDAEKASYSIDNVMYAVTQVAQTVMRNAIGKMSLGITFKKRETLNANIVEAINDVASQWGLICTRYEIRDIILPPGIRDSMVMQAKAERRRRAEIMAEIIEAYEAAKINLINRATGEAEAIKNIAESIQGNGGQAAASIKVAQDYVEAFNKMAKESTLPAPLVDPSVMAVSVLALFKNLRVEVHGKNTLQERFKLVDSIKEMIALYKNLIGDAHDEESSKLIDFVLHMIAHYKNFIGDAHDKNIFQEKSKLIDSTIKIIEQYKNLIGDEHDEESSKVIDYVTQIIAFYKNFIENAHDKNTFQERSKLIDNAIEIIELHKNFIGDAHDEESSKLIDSATQIIALYKDEHGKNTFQERSKLIDSATQKIALYKNLIGDALDEESSKLIDSATHIIAQYKNLIGDAHDKNTFQGISNPIDSGTQIIEAEVIDEKSSSSLKRPEKN
ncbi:uncharacterized protein LOC141609398 [Silene latifolia]|uniref:uncharacterized protein LOC141609398 n=1 Tax=Silene latifolia TaxID=37657 RepID=UPI003D78504A